MVQLGRLSLLLIAGRESNDFKFVGDGGSCDDCLMRGVGTERESVRSMLNYQTISEHRL